MTIKNYCVLLVCHLFITSGLAKAKILVVDQSGSGDYVTVQAAFDAIPGNNKKEVIIYVKNGVYQEKLHLDKGKNKVSLVGEDRFHTILTYNDHSGKRLPSGQIINTRTSHSFLINADDFYAENISFRNDAGFSAGQAVAVEANGDRLIFNSCRFLGNQDILFLNSKNSRQYYKDCYIEGTTDFIFGDATAWFQQCHIHTKKNSHVTAASSPKENPFGFVFYDCTITGDTTITNASLGRPWQPYAAVAYIHCYIDRIIRSEGWSKWNDQETFTLARYVEYQNYGPRGDFAGRVNWARQLSSGEVEKYTIRNVLAGWTPRRPCIRLPD